MNSTRYSRMRNGMSTAGNRSTSKSGLYLADRVIALSSENSLPIAFIILILAGANRNSSAASTKIVSKEKFAAPSAKSCSTRKERQRIFCRNSIDSW